MTDIELKPSISMICSLTEAHESCTAGRACECSCHGEEAKIRRAERELRIAIAAYERGE